MEYNILKLVLDRSGRLIDSLNLSLNQCSNNNRIQLYYDGDYDYIEMSFRKPDGWLSDKVTLTFDVDEENYKYAYYDIDEDFTSFIMGGRNAILIGNIYLHSGMRIATIGNIRINVNYVDDALVHTNYSEAYMHNINSQIGALQNDLNKFKTGDVLVGKAISDQHGKTIDIYYETKADALDKYDDLNQKKLDKSEVQDQTNRLEILETNQTTNNDRLTLLENDLDLKESQIDTNTENIELLNTNKVSSSELEKAIQDRIDAENKLQSQIDDLSSSENVKDIVGTRTALEAYDTSKLEVGDKIQVMADAFYSNLTTIHRWNGVRWEYVGTYASTSYSKGEVDTLVNSVRAAVPNKIIPENNSIYLYKDATKLNQDSPVTFKTINGKSLIGSGNIVTDTTDSAFSATSTNPVQNKLITAALSNKADKSQITNLETSVNSKADISELEKKQDKLTAGANVVITEDGVISVSSAISFRKVDELPAIGESNIIYLIKSTADEYTEYVWVDNRWEALGNPELNLENYYTASKINELLAAKASQDEVTRLSSKVSDNTVAIASKADASTTSSSISLLNQSVTAVNTSLANKADKSELEAYALAEDIPDISTKQNLLVSGENIKTINGVSLLGNGNIQITSQGIADLSNYVTKAENTEVLLTKADKSELFDRDYNSLNNLPNLDFFATDDDITSVRQYVDDSISAIPNPDMSDYYTKSEVDSAIENVDVTDQLGNYYTKSEVDTAIAGVDVSAQLSSYAKETWVQSQGYLKSSEAASTYVVKSELPTVPTTLSSFTNDAKFATTDYVLEKKEEAIESAHTHSDSNLEIAKVYTDLEIKKASETTLTEAKTYSNKNLTTSKEYTDNKVIDVETKINNLIGGAPDTLSTLKQIADYINQDKSAASSMLAAIDRNSSNVTKVELALNDEIQDRKDAISTVETNLATEISTRDSEVKALTKKITDETSNRTSAIKSVESKITEETTNRGIAINNVESKLTTESDERKAADAALGERITTEITSVRNEIASLDTSSLSERITKNTGRISILESDMDDVQSDISSIENRITELNTGISNVYTKSEADNKFLEYSETISKAESLIDFADSAKAIRFSSSSSQTDFIIEEQDSNAILQLLSMMVPNEY